ncbi:hypothetical protein [Deminuibacter soli]|nr:hypothetical protein [Deminuibacter soli]
MKYTLPLLGLLLSASTTFSQYRTQAQQLVMTNEDSLNAGGVQKNKTVISGYGSALYQKNFTLHQATAALDRAVLFVGHQFNAKIAFFSELEVENAVVANDGSDEFRPNGKGNVAMEQAYLRFNLNPKQYIVAGLFTPRIGIVNENHLPVNFNGVERPIVEQEIIPTTWREVGVGFYGSLNRLPLNYSIAVVNGLNSANFEHGGGIGGGIGQGSVALANNLAVTGSLQYLVNNFKFQVSGYAGGTVGLSPHSADSLGLNSGAFGTPVYLGEADVQYSNNGFSAKALGTYISYPDADKVYQAYGKNLATGMYGAYAELAYDLLYKRRKEDQLIVFARGEMLNLNSSVAGIQKGLEDPTLKQTHIVAGLGYLPIPNVVIKADVRLVHTGPQNSALVINPPPNALPYKQNNSILNIGIGYSF